MRRIVFGLLIIIGFLLLSCRKDEPPCLTCPPPNKQLLRLDTLIVDPTQVWLRLYTIDSTNVGLVELYRDSVPILAGMVSRNEITSVDSGLLPNLPYNYRAYRWENGIRVDSTALFVVRTMDTTRHNFTWEMYTLGDGASSVLYDVTIINDTLVYAVGELYLRDSSGQIDPIAYSVAIWNGSTWQLKRLFYSGNNLIAPIRGVFAFGANDIWLAAGSMFHWDGVRTQAELRFSRLSLPDPNATVEELWGATNSDLYGVGNVGTIVRYTSGTWQRVASGTTLPIQDIWGISDGRGGAYEIIAVASDKFFDRGKQILKIQGSTVTSYPDTGLTWSLSSIWFQHKQITYIAGDGLFKRTESQQNSPWVLFNQGLTTYYTDAIQGQNSNDIAVVGAYGVVLHFNGVSWRNYQNQTYLTAGSYYRVALKRNLLVAVGHIGNRAVALIGKR